jgi:NAD(P)-dependent dehydrogenase (short-subunit alcohol dehydrogenase family)
MSDELFSVAGQVVLISGGSRGIGRELTRGFAERGAQVVITGREKKTLEESAAAAGGDLPVKPVVCDVSNVEDVERTVAEVVDEFGRIDTLLNVAGVNQRKRVETFTAEEYDFILDINLKGAFWMAKEVGRHMIERGVGSQIHVDSLNTFAPLKGVLPYAMSKAGLGMMTRGMATEWGEYGVRVNALAPGFVLTDMTRKLWSDPTMHDWGKKNTPLGRLGEVEDMVGTAVFLASKASAFITGQILYVDGGMTAGISWPIDL